MKSWTVFQTAVLDTQTLSNTAKILSLVRCSIRTSTSWHEPLANSCFFCIQKNLWQIQLQTSVQDFNPTTAQFILYVCIKSTYSLCSTSMAFYTSQRCRPSNNYDWTVCVTQISQLSNGDFGVIQRKKIPRKWVLPKGDSSPRKWTHFPSRSLEANRKTQITWIKMKHGGGIQCDATRTDPCRSINTEVGVVRPRGVRHRVHISSTQVWMGLRLHLI